MQTGTFPLKELIDELLPEGEQCRTVSITIANIIFGHYKNKDTVYVQYEDVDDYRAEKPNTYILERPKLWRYAAWQQSSEMWRRGKDYSHRMRVAIWLREANIKITKTHIMRTLDFDEAAAYKLANILVINGLHQNIRAAGVKHILTKEEELH